MTNQHPSALPDKKALRQTMRERKKQHTPDELMTLSQQVLLAVEQHPRFAESKVVCIYYSLPDEVFTHQFIEKWHTHKTILLPTVEGDDILLKPYEGASHMAKGYYNIDEPTGNALFTDFDSIDLILVPGMAFDAEGNRLGRGKGYYDRFLPKLTRSYNIGICFPFQKVERVPHEPFDKPMDEVIVG